MASQSALVLIAVAALVVTTYLCVALNPVLKKVAVDQPTDRSSHVVPTPRGAGVAVVVGAVAGLIAGRDSADELVVLVPATMAVMGVGLVDDLHGLGVKVRLASVMLAATVTSAVLWSAEGASPSILVLLTLGSAFVILAYTNAFNFMDGINGISGLATAAVSLYLAWHSHVADLDALRNFALALGVAALAFLPFNVPRARMFMGDSGSYGIGFLLGCLGLWLGIGSGEWLVAVAPFGLYVLDTGVTLSRRMAAGKRFSEPHREHTYQRLARSLQSHVGAAVVVTVSIMLFEMAATFSDESAFWALAVALATASAYLSSPLVVDTIRAQRASGSAR